jgi:hypothetical protein
MLILGELNWKLPGRLDRVLPRLAVEGQSARRRGAIPAPAPAEAEKALAG